MRGEVNGLQQLVLPRLAPKRPSGASPRLAALWMHLDMIDRVICCKLHLHIHERMRAHNRACASCETTGACTTCESKSRGHRIKLLWQPRGSSAAYKPPGSARAPELRLQEAPAATRGWVPGNHP